MISQELVKISKFLSKVLRHKPELINLNVDKNGWVSVEELLENSNKNGYLFTLEELYEIVEENDKKRFALSEDKTKIRANQGHSFEVDLELKSIRPPDILYHGTTFNAISPIRKGGIQKMNRQHVHLSETIDVAIKVGSRKGKPEVLSINSKHMFVDGYKFYKSENGVWLTDSIPSKYIVF